MFRKHFQYLLMSYQQNNLEFTINRNYNQIDISKRDGVIVKKKIAKPQL